MGNFTKKTINDLFSESASQSYSIVIVEQRTVAGEPTDSKTMDEIVTGATNLLNAYYVDHFVEKYDTLLVCCINYTPDIFSIRAFAGSLRQTIYSMLPGSRSYIYYTQDLKYQEEVFAERYFLSNVIKYGALLGCSRPVHSDYIRNCINSPAEINHNIMSILYTDMNTKKYSRVADYLSKQAALFSDCQANSMFYDYNEMFQYISDVYSALKLFFSLSNTHFDWINKRVLDLLYELNGAGQFLKLLADSVSAYEKTFAQAPASEREQSNMAEILEYVNSNLGTTNLTETAYHFNLNQSYLCRLFKKNTGVNFNEYIRDKRYEQALVLLRDDSDKKLSIAKIAAMLGYKSQSHFQNSFKLKYGITPLGYRRNCHLQNQGDLF